jgi:hypothetical protein
MKRQCACMHSHPGAVKFEAKPRDPALHDYMIGNGVRNEKELCW